MNAIRLTLSIFLFAGLATAHSRYERIDTTDFVNHPDAYHGRLVEVTAEVIAINADSMSLQLFDARSKILIGVKVTRLQKAQRSALMQNPVHRLLVYGRAAVINGRLVIDAHGVEALPTEGVARHQASREGRGGTGAGGGR